MEAITYTPIYPGEIYSLPGVVSRKKQLLPFLTGALRIGTSSCRRLENGQQHLEGARAVEGMWHGGGQA